MEYSKGGHNAPPNQVIALVWIWSRCRRIFPREERSMICQGKRLCNFCGDCIVQGASFIATLIPGRQGNVDADYNHWHRNIDREADVQPDCYTRHCQERQFAKRAA